MCAGAVLQERKIEGCGEERRDAERDEETSQRDGETFEREGERDIGETRRKTDRRGEGARCAVRVLKKNSFTYPNRPHYSDFILGYVDG